MIRIISTMLKTGRPFCFALASLLAITLPGAGDVLAGEKFVDVHVGGSGEFDACGTIIAVSGLKSTADSFLALRTGPGTGYAMIAKLANDTELWFCQEKGKWLGVLVRTPEFDCGVSSPIVRRQPYHGACLSGWVYGKYTIAIAG